MGHNSTGSVWLALLLVLLAWPAFFLALWSVILFIMSALGGWRRLAALYGAAQPPSGGRQYAWMSGMLGIARYNRTLIVTASDAGIHIKTRRILGLFHPPVMIPWEDIRQPQRSSFLRRQFVSFDIGTPKIVRMTLQAAVFEGTPVAAALL